jgi:DNA-binding response OmpR family regulator
MMLRGDHPDLPPADAAKCGKEGSRLNLLLSYGGWRAESFADQLPRLLTPLGINSIRVDTGEEAERVIRTYAVHIAVVDLAIPLRKSDDVPRAAPTLLTEGGSRMLQLLRRLESPPPMVVIRPPAASARESVRSLLESLREGAFAVLDRPVDLENMLEVMRRILRRHYADCWPT